MKGMIFDIEHGSFVDGPGIRTTVFFKGCNLKCAWCHNPESQSARPQMMFYKDKCIGCGKCREVCPNTFKSCDLCGKCELYCQQNARVISGKEYSADELFSEIEKDRSFYENSDGGVTFSGGECMLQTDFLCEMLQKCKTLGIHTAVDTAGNVPFASFEKILPYTDLFLYDLKAIDNAIHQKYTGTDNHRILDNLSRLLLMKKRVWVRMPILSGINDGEEDMKKTAAFFKKYGSPEKIELLPYHSMGENKYPALGKQTTPFTPPTKEKLTTLGNILRIV